MKLEIIGKFNFLISTYSPTLTNISFIVDVTPAELRTRKDKTGQVEEYFLTLINDHYFAL